MAAAEDDDLAGLEDVSSEDEDYKYEDDVSDVDADASGSSSARRAYLLKKKARCSLFSFLDSSYNFSSNDSI